VNSLSTAGFQVTHVTGGGAALDAIRVQDFGVVILNLDVPELDGFTVLSEIRMHPPGGTPVMIVSSHHQEQDILRAFELGADDYVTIPFSPMEVVARVRRLVKQGAHVS
jgi:DNA-binding response OmpR family regulator